MFVGCLFYVSNRVVVWVKFGSGGAVVLDWGSSVYEGYGERSCHDQNGGGCCWGWILSEVFGSV